MKPLAVKQSYPPGRHIFDIKFHYIVEIVNFNIMKRLMQVE